MILSFPSTKNIQASRGVLSESFAVERDVVWVNGLIILLFAIPSVLLFFTQGRPDSFVNYNTISDVPLSKDIETLKQNVYDIDVDIIDGNIVFKCGTLDPQFLITLQNVMEKPAGSPFVELTYINSQSGMLQIFYDYGAGYSERHSIISSIMTSNDEELILLRVVNWKNRMKLVGIRIDPPHGTEFVLKKVRILSME
jgi:hypothetical protein